MGWSLSVNGTHVCVTAHGRSPGACSAAARAAVAGRSCRGSPRAPATATAAAGVQHRPGGTADRYREAPA